MSFLSRSFIGSAILWTLLVVVGCSGDSSVSAPEKVEEKSKVKMAIESGPINLSNHRRYLLSGSCHPDGGTVSVAFGDDALTWLERFLGYSANNYLSGKYQAACEGGKWSLDNEIDFNFLPEGEAVVLSLSYDGETLRSDLSKDTVPPTGDATADDANISDIINKESVASFALSGACPEEGRVRVDLAGSTLGRGECLEDTEAETWSWVLEADFTDVEDAAGLGLSFIFEDAHGNATTSKLSVALTLAKDVVAPDLEVHPLEAININGQELTGSCLDGAGNVSVKVAEATAEEVSCASNAWTFNLSSFSDPEFVAVVSYSDAAGNIAEVTVGPLARDVDAPTVIGDYEVLDGTYHPGGILSFAINYSEDVIVEGVPTLAFELGANGSATTKQALYAEGSGTGQLVFKYPIVVGDSDGDGIQIIESSALTFTQGVKIRDGAGNTIVASPPVKNFSSVLIAASSTVTGTIGNFAPGEEKTYKAGDVLTITANLGGNIDLAASDAPSLSLVLGEVSVEAACVSSVCDGTAQSNLNELQFSYTIKDGENASRVLVKALDAGGIGTLGLGIFLPFHLRGVVVDTTKPVVTGLSDGSAPVKSAQWAWECEDTSACTYRNVVSEGDSYTWVNESFGETSTVGTSNATTGKWYLHVQAKDAVGNKSETKTVFVDIDVTPPTLASGDIMVPAAGAYGYQDELEFQVSFSEAMLVTGSPRLTLTVGSQTRYVDYHGIDKSGQNVIFRYVVASDDADADGIALTNKDIDKNGGTLTDQAGNDVASLAFSATLPAITIDSAPSISQMVLGGNLAKTAYKIDDAVTIDVTFSESVVVTGHPVLLLDVGGARVRASYKGNGVSATLHSFGFDVVAPINSATGFSVLSLELGQGGSIVDDQQITAVLDFETQVFATVALDTIFPRPTSIEEAPKSASSVEWSWGCSESNCTYRSVINEQAQHSFESAETYGTTTNLSEASGLTEGSVYYLHLQIKDAVGNEGEVFHYSTHYDTTAPLIVALSAVPDDKTYVYGESLTFSVRFDEAVIVGMDSEENRPVLKIRVRDANAADDDNQLREVPYLEGSGTDTLVFKYVVPEGLVDSDGIELSSVITLKGATIKDGAGNDFDVLGTFTVPPNMSINLDGAAPYVSSVKFVDTDSAEIAEVTHLKEAGEGLIELTLSEDVTLDTAQGSPELVLDVGGVAVRAIYQPPAVSITNIRKLLFKYTVQAGDNDSDGVDYTEVDLNGAVLLDLSKSGLVPLTAGSLTTFIIDTTAPTVTLARADGVMTLLNGSFDVTVTFSESVNDFAVSDVTVDNNATVEALSGLGAVYTVTVVPEVGTDATLNINILEERAQDLAGNQNTASSILQVPVDGASPTVAITGTPSAITTLNESSYTISGTCSENGQNVAILLGSVTKGTAVCGAGAWTKTFDLTSDADADDTVNWLARHADAAGNSVDSAGKSVTRDTILPTITLALDSGSATEPSKTASWGLSCNDTIGGCQYRYEVITATGVTCNFAALSSPDWQGSLSTTKQTVTKSDGDGDFTVCAQAKDDQGNVGVFVKSSDKAKLDNIGPRISSIERTSGTGTINTDLDFTVTFSEPVKGLVPAGFTVTHGGSVAGISCSDGLSTCTGTLTPPATYDGSVTVTVKKTGFTDMAGNAATGVTRAMSVDVDTQGPTVTIARIIGSATDPSKTATWDLSCDDTDGCQYKYKVINASGVTCDATALSGTNWEPVSLSTDKKTVTKLDGNGDFTVCAQAKDGQGNVGDFLQATGSTYYAKLDNMAPTVAITGTPPAITTLNESSYTIAGTCSEDGQDVEILLAGTSKGTVVCGSGWTKTFDLTSDVDADDTVNWLARHADAAGNSTDSADVPVTRDTTLPTIRFALDTGSATEPSKTASWGLSCNDTIGGCQYKYKVITTAVTCNAAALTGTTWPGSLSTTKQTVTKSVGNGDFTVCAQAKDDQGNVGDFAKSTNNAKLDNIGPTITSIERTSGEATGTINAPLGFTVTFSEPVKEFDSNDFTVTSGGGSVGGINCSPGASTCTGTLTPSANHSGTVVVTVKITGFTDIAGNTATGNTQAMSVEVDTQGPTVTIARGDIGSDTVPSKTATWVLSCPEANGCQYRYKMILASGVCNATALSGISWLPVSPSTADQTVTKSDGDRDFTVCARARDDQTNVGDVVKSSEKAKLDNTAPTISSIGRTSGQPTGTINAPLDFTVTFSEPVKDFDFNDFTVSSGGSVSGISWSVGASTCTGTLTPSANHSGNVTVTVKNTGFTDIAENAVAGVIRAMSVEVDTQAPTVTLARADGFATTLKGSFNVTVTFSESVNNFEVGDVTVDNSATVGGFTGSGPVYTVTVVPAAGTNATLDIKILESIAQDLVGNENTASSILQVPVDMVPPTVAITSTPPAITTLNEGAYAISGTCSENDQNVDILLAGTSKGIVACASGTWSQTLNLGADADADDNVIWKARHADAAGNSVDSTGVSVTRDTIAPTVTLALVGATPPLNGNFNVTVTFNESVSNFVAGDVTVDNGATVGSLTESGNVYTVTVTPAPGTDTTLNISISASIAQDSAENQNTASSTLGVRVDMVPPTVSFVPYANNVYSSVTAFHPRILFSEAIKVSTYNATADIVIVNAAKESWEQTWESGIKYGIQIKPTDNAHANHLLITLDMAAGAVTDLAGNPNIVAPTRTIRHRDRPDLTVTLTDPPASHDGSTAFDLTVTFVSGASGVKGFDAASDITVTGGTAADPVVGSDATTYTVSVTPTPSANAAIVVSIAAGVATDILTGAGNTAMAGVTIAYVAPTGPGRLLGSLAEKKSVAKSCPRGYEEVLEDEEFETSRFCAMTSLVREVDEEGEREIVVSEAVLAQDYCLDFGALISEGEWMAMAGQHGPSESLEIQGQEWVIGDESRPLIVSWGDDGEALLQEEGEAGFRCVFR